MTSKSKELGLLAGLWLILLGRLAHGGPDPDLWGYLSFGRLFWESGRFPRTDPFSYLPTIKPWVFHEWLTSVLFYPVYQAVGAAGLQALRYLLAMETIGLLYAAARKRGGGPVATTLCLLAAGPLLCFGYSPVRAGVFTYFFLALTLWLLEAHESRLRRRLWLFPLLGAAWANLHGGFAAGAGVIFLYGLGRALTRRPFFSHAAAFALFAVGTLANPYGVRLWTFVARASAAPWPEITEWLSVFQAVHLPEYASKYMLLSALCGLMAAGAVRRRLETGPLLALIACAWLAFAHARHVTLFAIAFMAYAPACLDALSGGLSRSLAARMQPRTAKRLSFAGMAFFAACSLAYFASSFLMAAPFSLQAPSSRDFRPDRRIFYYPDGAVDFIRANRIRGNILADFAWGSYLTWSLFPQCKVAVDGRTDSVYPESVHQEYLAFRKAREGWRAFLEKYPPTMVLCPHSPITGLLAREPGWRMAYQDPGCVLLLKD